jgi:hypothetical protein
MLAYLPVIYLCVGGIYWWYMCVLGVSTGDIFVCWVYLLVIYLCVGGIYRVYIFVLTKKKYPLIPPTHKYITDRYPQHTNISPVDTPNKKKYIRGIYWWYICVLGVSIGDIFVCWGYLLVIYFCVGVSTGDLFVCWVYLLVIYLCVGGIYWW